MSGGLPVAKCVRGDGLHKKAWTDRAAARQAARATPSHLGRMEPYRCPECRFYHIGHPRKDERE